MSLTCAFWATAAFTLKSWRTWSYEPHLRILKNCGYRTQVVKNLIIWTSPACFEVLWLSYLVVKNWIIWTSPARFEVLRLSHSSRKEPDHMNLTCAFWSTAAIVLKSWRTWSYEPHLRVSTYRGYCTQVKNLIIWTSPARFELMRLLS